MGEQWLVMAITDNTGSGDMEAGILENALVMIIVLDKTGKIITWNHAAENITGYSKEDVIGGKNIWKKLYPDKKYRDSITTQIASVLTKKNFFENFETTIMIRSGESRFILWNSREIIQKGVSRIVSVGQDITHIKELDAFRQSIIDNANDLITVLDSKGKILVWNRAAEFITGFAQTEVTGSSEVWKRLYPDADYRLSVTKRISDILNTHKYFENFETTIVTKNGEKRILSWNTRQMESGGNFQAIAIGRDITEIAKVKLEIKKNAEFQESIISNANVLITVLDSRGSVLVWNKGAEFITGYSQNEVIGTVKVWKWVYPDAEYRRNITQQITSIISTHNYFENLETTIVTKSGEQRIISWNTRQIGLGSDYQAIAIGRDITDRKRAEEALVAYMTEMAMRMKQPVEIIRDVLHDVTALIRAGKITQEETAIILQGQVRSATQVAANVQEFQKEIAEKNPAIPDAYRKFLEGE